MYVYEHDKSSVRMVVSTQPKKKREGRKEIVLIPLYFLIYRERENGFRRFVYG